jgi:preprotein translocase subunit SecG
MQTVLIVIHLMVVIALVAVVLLQRSEGGALGVGGGSGFMTGRGQANVLTRATAILATLFFITSLALTILANLNRAPKSILDGAAPPVGTAVPAGAPAGNGNLLDELKKMESQRPSAPPSPETPAVPEAPRPQ